MIYFAIYIITLYITASYIGYIIYKCSISIYPITCIVNVIVKYFFINYNMFSIVCHTVKMITLQKGLKTNIK